MVKHRIWSRNKGISFDWNSFYASYWHSALRIYFSDKTKALWFGPTLLSMVIHTKMLIVNYNENVKSWFSINNRKTCSKCSFVAPMLAMSTYIEKYWTMKCIDSCGKMILGYSHWTNPTIILTTGLCVHIRWNMSWHYPTLMIICLYSILGSLFYVLLLDINVTLPKTTDFMIIQIKITPVN